MKVTYLSASGPRIVGKLSSKSFVPPTYFHHGMSNLKEPLVQVRPLCRMSVPKNGGLDPKAPISKDHLWFLWCCSRRSVPNPCKVFILLPRVLISLQQKRGGFQLAPYGIAALCNGTVARFDDRLDIIRVLRQLSRSFVEGGKALMIGYVVELQDWSSFQFHSLQVFILMYLHVQDESQFLPQSMCALSQGRACFYRAPLIVHPHLCGDHFLM